MYTFQKCREEMLPRRRALIRNVYEMEDGQMHSLFLGQVLELFGEVDYMTPDNENMFGCAVAATDEEGHTVYLEVYYGPSGPAIGGGDSLEERRAAFALDLAITKAKPRDYTWKGIYPDTFTTVRMGVKDGEPYYEGWFNPLNLLDMFPIVRKIRVWLFDRLVGRYYVRSENE